MLVKFHKGPYHGKVKEIDPTFCYPRLEVAIPVRKRSIADYGEYRATGNHYNFHFEERRGHYEAKMMRLTLGGLTYQAPAMHPDGMVYYVWAGYHK